MMPANSATSMVIAERVGWIGRSSQVNLFQVSLFVLSIRPFFVFSRLRRGTRPDLGMRACVRTLASPNPGICHGIPGEPIFVEIVDLYFNLNVLTSLRAIFS